MVDGFYHLRYNVSQYKGGGDMSTTTTMVHVRIDEHIKASAAKTLATMGLSISDAVRVFLTRVVLDKQIPFDIHSCLHTVVMDNGIYPHYENTLPKP